MEAMATVTKGKAKLEIENDYRTYQIHIKKGNKLHSYFSELCSNANNLYNTTNFYIRQVYTALRQEKKLESLQKEVWETICNNLDEMNDKQTIAYYKRLIKEKEKPLDERRM